MGQFNELSPTQTVAGKDTTNPFMSEVFSKSLIVRLTQQVVEILKKDLCKEVESESSRSIESPRKEDKDVRVNFSPKMFLDKI